MRTLELNFCKIKIRVKGLRRIRVWIGEQCQLAQVSIVFLAAHQPFHRPMFNVLFLDRKLVSGSVHVILFFNGAWIGICHFTRYLASFGRLEMNVWKLPPILGGRMLHILSYLHRVCTLHGRASVRKLFLVLLVESNLWILVFVQLLHRCCWRTSKRADKTFDRDWWEEEAV